MFVFSCSCMISIQKQVVAEAFGISKVLARSKAAYLTLCQLIENNHPLINVSWGYIKAEQSKT